MALVDSNAAFVSHCDAIDPSFALKNLCINNGLRTFSQLAFAIGTPQQPCTDDEFKTFSNVLNGGIDLTVGALSQFRRLHFESQTLVVAHLKSQVTTDPSSEAPKKLPQAEKLARLQEQQGRLVGIDIKGELQPSFALIDLVASIAETNSVIWIAPSRCSKRDTEIQGTLKEKSQTLVVEQQTLKMSVPESKLHVDTSSEIQLQWALQRRGLAMDQCNLIRYGTHDKWVQTLMTSLTNEPPPGFSKISMEQVIRADKHIFTLMAQEISGSLKATVAGVLPMDEKLLALKVDPRITMYLLPLPKNVKVAPSADVEEKPDKVKPPKPVPKKKARPSPKAKSKCPGELQGYNQLNPDGVPVCWAFNMASGCSETTSNGRCKKGSHECIKCNRNNHALPACRVGRKH